MIKVVFHGLLAKKFGKEFKIDVSTPSEIIACFVHQLKGFRKIIEDHHWYVIRGDIKEGWQLTERELGLTFGKTQEFHLVPAIEGAGGGKKGGLFKAIAGYLLIPLGVVLTGVGLGSIGVPLILAGVGMVVGGVSQMLTPKPKLNSSNYGGREAPDSRGGGGGGSFIFSGPVNKSEQGSPVPLVYGQIRTGSTIVSAGISTENI